MIIVKVNWNDTVKIKPKDNLYIAYPISKDIEEIIEFVKNIKLDDYDVERIEISTDPIYITVSDSYRKMTYKQTDFFPKLESNSIKTIIIWMLNNFNNTFIRDLEIAETSSSILINSDTSTHTLLSKNCSENIFHVIMDKLHIYKHLILFNLNKKEMNFVKNQFDKLHKFIYELRYPVIIISKNSRRDITIHKYATSSKIIRNIHELDLIPYVIETNITDDELRESIYNTIKLQLL
jgi:hypothetical protein